MKKTMAKVIIVLLMVSLSLTTVTAFTPPGLAKKGGLPPGIQKRFIPDNDLSIETVIEEIDTEDRRIIVKDGTAILNLLVAKDAKIRIDGKDKSISDLRVDYKVKLKLDKDNTIIEIVVTSVVKDDRQIIEGKIIDIDEDDKEIEIKYDNKTKEFDVSKQVIIKEGNKIRSFADLEENMEVKVEIVDNKIVKIEIKTTQQTKITGTINLINTSTKELVIKKDSSLVIYETDAKTKIYINNKLETFGDLEVGMKIEAYIDDSKIVSLYTNFNYIEIEAVVNAVDVTSRELKIKYDNKLEIYKVNSTATIEIDGIKHRLSSIKPGMEVEIKIQSNEITEIIVINEIVTFEGRLVGFKTSGTQSITLEIDNERETYNLASSYVTTKPLTQLIGKDIEISVKDSLVIAIQE